MAKVNLKPIGNPGQKAAYNHNYYLEHREAIAVHGKQYYAANRERYKEQGKIHRAENKDKIRAYKHMAYKKKHLAYTGEEKAYNRERSSAYMKQYRVDHPEFSKNRHLQERFGITLGDFNKIFDAQHGKCALCGEEMERDKGKTGRKVVIDHNHETGRIRGLVHRMCNLLLGLVGDDTEILRKAITYLEEYRKDEL